jgi:uncharacterized protein (UPF0333 family)
MLKSKKGQVLVEYLLLMVIAVGISAFLTKKLIQRDPAQPGLITGAWNKILINIGKDVPDCKKPDCAP